MIPSLGFKRSGCSETGQHPAIRAYDLCVSAKNPNSPTQTRSVSARRDDALAGSDIVELLDRIRRREVNANELILAARERAANVDPQLNAVADWLPNEVTGTGPFAGVPTFLKDNEDLAGSVTSHGSAAVPRVVRNTSTAFPKHLQDLGFTMIGKTTLPEFGLTATTESIRFGPTRNPWNPNHSTGGSSGGSAALVAAGVVPLAHANDGGGSIRIPASCCGLVGLKPTQGRLVPIEAMSHLPIKVATQGVLTRTVRDTALFYAEAEKLYQDPSLAPMDLVTEPNKARLRIGIFTRGFRGQQVDADTATAVTQAGVLCESLGHSVEPIDFPFADSLGPDFLRYWELLAWLVKRFGSQIYGNEFDRSKLEIFTVGLARHLGPSRERVPLSIARLRKFARKYDQHFDRFDVLVSPVLGHAPPQIGYLGTDVPFDTHLIRLLRYASFTPLQNISGAPAISLPLGRSGHGLPIGVQFAAPLGAERTLLELAFELEVAQPWQTL